MSYKEGDDKMSLTDDIVGQLMNKTENELPRLLKMEHLQQARLQKDLKM